MTSFQANPPVSVEMYTQGTGTSSSDPFITVFATRDPTTFDYNYPIKKRWINTTPGSVTEWILTGYSNVTGQTLATWISIGIGGFTTGSFSPGVSFGGSEAGNVYDPQLSYYTQIENVVTVNINLILTTKGSGVGVALLEHLPVTAGPNSPYSLNVNFASLLTISAATTCVTAYTNGATTNAQLISSNYNGGTVLQLGDTNFTNGTQLVISGSYIVA